MNVCEVTRYGDAPRLLVEVPHGATHPAEYAAFRTKMRSDLPADLDHFFYVNTDIGAPEGAHWLGEKLADLGVVVARCRIPRTFIDTNRIPAPPDGGKLVGGMTPGIPGYVSDARDVAWLTEQHAAYHAIVAPLYAEVCAAGGIALQLHSYAPKSVDIDATDANIVAALHAAYEPLAYKMWPERPQVDVICATPDGTFECNPALVAAVRAAYADISIAAARNGTYHLHPATMGMHYARSYPDRVLCIELRRDMVADPFTPFGVSPISASKVAAMCAPIAKVLREALSQ